MIPIKFDKNLPFHPMYLALRLCHPVDFDPLRGPKYFPGAQRTAGEDFRCAGAGCKGARNSTARGDPPGGAPGNGEVVG